MRTFNEWTLKKERGFFTHFERPKVVPTVQQSCHHPWKPVAETSTAHSWHWYAVCWCSSAGFSCLFHAPRVFFFFSLALAKEAQNQFDGGQTTDLIGQNTSLFGHLNSQTLRKLKVKLWLLLQHVDSLRNSRTYYCLISNCMFTESLQCYAACIDPQRSVNPRLWHLQDFWLMILLINYLNPMLNDDQRQWSFICQLLHSSVRLHAILNT